MAVSRSKSQEGKPHKRPLAGLVGLVAAVCMAVMLAACKAQVEVPELDYKDVEEATAELEKVGLKLGTVEEKETDEILVGGFVIDQSPKKGEKVDEGSAVNITISAGPGFDDVYPVPDIVGMTVEEAELALYSEAFIPQPGEPQYSDKVEPGKVCAQSVKAGEKIHMLDVVVYSVSLGKEKVAVPDVSGKPVHEARDILGKAGLGCDTTQSYSDSVAKDSVISQSIAADEKVEKGSVVTLEVSLGVKPPEKVKVPNIYSYDLNAAKRTLESYGFAYEWSGDENGNVTRMNPAPDTELDKGGKVTFELTAPIKVVQVQYRDAPQQSQPAQQESQPAQQETQPAEEVIEERGDLIEDEPEVEKEEEEPNLLTHNDVLGIVESWGLGEVSGDPTQVKVENTWYWEVITTTEDGEVHDYYVTPEGIPVEMV